MFSAILTTSKIVCFSTNLVHARAHTTKQIQTHKIGENTYRFFADLLEVKQSKTVIVSHVSQVIVTHCNTVGGAKRVKLSSEERLGEAGPLVGDACGVLQSAGNL